MKPLLKAEIQKRLDLVSKRAATLEVRVIQLTDALEETGAQLRQESIERKRIQSLYEEARNENHSLEARARNAEAALEDKIKQTLKSFFRRLIGY